MSLQPGDRFGGYQLIERLGAGGMGEVWLARDETLARRVAVKLLPEEVTRDAFRVSRFEQEARAASALNHPNVCHIYALGTTQGGQRFIAMELVEGQTLRSRLGRERVPLREALQIANQVASALAAAHALGIVHRDIKPENVMLRPDGIVKVLDFGLAKLANTIGSLAHIDSTQTLLRTDAGTVVGTLTYMSPEQARGKDVDARTDIWSLGVVLYEMVAGRSPFAGPSGSDVVAAILDRTPDPLTGFQPDVPPELQRIVTKTLRKDCAHRYQSVRDLQLDLQALLDELVAVAASPSSDPTFRTAATATRARSDDRPHAQSSAELLVEQVNRHRFAASFIALVGLAFVSAIVWWSAYRRQAPDHAHTHEPVMKRLTANPSDLSLNAAMMSPDGRYFAFTDPTGIQVLIIDTGETQRLPETKGMTLYGWSSDSTKVRASGCESVTCTGWSISLLGGSRTRVDGSWPVGETVFKAPNLSGLLKATAVTDGAFGALRYDYGPFGELRYDPMDGTPSRLIARQTTQYFSSATADHVLFVTDGVLKSVSVQGGTPVTVWRPQSGWQIMGVADLPDQRMIVGVSSVGAASADPAGVASVDAGVTFYELRRDAAGVVVGSPRRLTDSRQNAVRWMTASTDGKRIAFLSSDFQSDVYVSDFNLQRLTLSTPKRLTLDDRLDFPTAWTRDSKSILFTSTRNGTYDLFRQDIDTGVLEVLVAGPYDQLEPRVTDDGRWVLYKEILADQQVRLMRVRVTGGAGQVVCPITNLTFPLCSAIDGCIAFEVRPSASIVFSVDVSRGKGPEVAKLPRQTTRVALLPDGKHVAFVVPQAGQQNRIRLVSLSGEPQREVVVKQATRLVSIDALSNGLGFFSTNSTAKGTELLFIRPDGTSRTVWSPTNGAEVGWGIPSPDGRHVAINVNVPQRNAWMMTDF